MNKIILIILTFICLNAASQNVQISGMAKPYKNRTVVVFTEQDFISHKRVALTQTVIDPDGKFSLSFPLDETRELILSVASIEATLYAEPGGQYEVTIPAFIANNQAKKFDQVNVELSFQKMPATDLNMLIREFNARYTQFVNDHYMDFAMEQYRGSETYKVTNKNLQETGLLQPPCENCPGQMTASGAVPSFHGTVEEFRVNIEEQMGKYMGNFFFRDYARYHIAQLELVSGVSKQFLIEEYFFSQPFQYGHPIFMQCFEMFYKDMLEVEMKDGKKDSIVMVINGWRDVKSLDRIMKGNSNLSADHVRQMTLLLELHEQYYLRNFNQTAIDELLRQLVPLAVNKTIATTAWNIVESLSRNKAGWQVEDFALQNEKGSVYKLSENNGKYRCIFFYANWCAGCIKELMMMEKLKADYGSVVEFICISMDEDKADFQEYLSKNVQQDFVFLYGPDDPLIKEKFQLRSIPGIYMIDLEGKLMFNQTRKPSEGLASELAPLKARMEKGQGKQGQKTWKE